jgi:biotin transport system substrate-specific component
VSNRLPARDLALVATFAGFIAVLGLPGTLAPFGGGVPITAQTLGVMLAGSLLGARRGAWAVLVFLALVAAGLPLLAGGRGGLVVFTGPSAGFLAGWVAGAWVVGRLAEWSLAAGPRAPAGRPGRPRGPVLAWLLLANVVGGLAVVYAVGIPVRAAVTSLSVPEAALTSLVFVPGDLLKAAVAAVVARAVHRGYPVLLPQGAPRTSARTGAGDRPG